MAKPRNKYVDLIVYIALRLMAMMMQMFDVRANYVTATILGDLMYRFDRRHRRLAVEHLRRSFPDWPEQKLHHVARESMKSMACMAMEFMFTTRLIAPGTWRRHIVLNNTAENLRMLTRREQGVIYVTGHFGNWEVLGYTMAAFGFDGFAVARPPDNPYINRYVMRVRQQRGMTILDKKGATERMDEILDSRRYVGFIADQDAGKRGLYVDFFGRAASTTKAPALIAMQHNIPLVVGYGRRLDYTFRFEIGVERIISPQEWADKDDPLRWLTQEYTSALEAVIRRTPEQYLWMHRRWKHRPKGEQPSPDGVA